MGKVLIDIQKGFIAKIPLKANKNSVTHERVYAKKDSLRWNRMYAHLWQHYFLTDIDPSCTIGNYIYTNRICFQNTCFNDWVNFFVRI